VALVWWAVCGRGARVSNVEVSCCLSRFAEVGDVLAEAEVLCTAILDNKVFDKLYSLVK
jgi:hypothetical protein